MFRSQWKEIEENILRTAAVVRDSVFQKIRGGQVEKFINRDAPIRKEEFIDWGKDYIRKLQERSEGEKVQTARENFFILLRNLGINDQLLRETFNQNKKELLDPVVGEAVAIVSLVLGWTQKDKEGFSQALGEIGVVGLFAAKPFICLVAICGLAYGYQEHFHGEAFKKGGVLGLAGLTAAILSPGGFVGLLTAIVTMLYLNKKLKVDRPIEVQMREIFAQIKNGDFFKEVRGSWSQFEEFLSKLFRREPTPKETGVSPV